LTAALVDTDVDALEAHLKKFVIVPFSRSLSRQWAEVKYFARKDGHPLNDADAWIASTALLYELPLITHNRSHYLYVRNLTIISVR